GFDYDANRNRRAPDTNGFGVETDQISDEYRLDEDDFAHRYSDDLFGGVFVRFHGGRLVDIAEKHAAEDCAEGICISRHHRHPNRRLSKFAHKAHYEKFRFAAVYLTNGRNCSIRCATSAADLFL